MTRDGAGQAGDSESQPDFLNDALEGPNMEVTDFPLFAPVGYIVRISGWGGSGDVSSISIADQLVAGEIPSVEVTTEKGSGRFFGDETDQQIAREHLELALTNLDPETADPLPEMSPEAVARWFDEYDREREQAAARAEVSHCEISIDGKKEAWTVAVAGDTWAAIRQHGPVMIKVSARDKPIAEMRIRRVEDPVRELSTPEMPEMSEGEVWTVTSQEVASEEEPAAMASGTVDSWNEERGWGVISSPEVPGKLFAHFSEVEGDGYRSLDPGVEVTFEYRACPLPGEIEGCPFVAERIALK